MIDGKSEHMKTAKRFTFKWEEDTKDVITTYIERTIKSTAHEKRDIDINKYNTLPYGYKKYKYLNIDMSKSDIIEKVYYDLFGYGSIQNTLKEARKYDKTITYDDVKEWKQKEPIGQKRQLRGMNSYIAKEPLEEFQMDLLFFSDIDKNSVCLLMVDIFTKYTYVVELKSKQTNDVLDGIKNCFDKIGVCKSIYCDNEGAFL